jgi:hypothetical protein
MEDEMGQPLVTQYQLRDSRGRRIRLASMVTLEDGTEVRFVERLPNGEAIRQARAEREVGWGAPSPADLVAVTL